jgi:hypothetical protein
MQANCTVSFGSKIVPGAAKSRECRNHRCSKKRRKYNGTSIRQENWFAYKSKALMQGNFREVMIYIKIILETLKIPLLNETLSSTEGIAFIKKNLEFRRCHKRIGK